MSFWIKTRSENEATGSLKAIYDAGIERAGKVFNIIKAMSLRPSQLRGSMMLYESTMFQKSGLSRSERELVAVVVSQSNGCFYWIEAHARSLRDEGEDSKWVKNLKDRGYAAIFLDHRQLAICRYSEKLTLSPKDMTEADLNPLKEVGFTDEDILDLVQVISYFNYINRIADAVGVPPEADWTTDNLS